MSSPDRVSVEPFADQLRADHSGERTVFVMMRFAQVHLLNTLYKVLNDELAAAGFVALRADEKQYASELWPNVQAYLLGAEAGIAIFDNVPAGGKLPVGFNPNVSVEAGYMMGLDKPVMLLKDKHLERMPTDFGGKLYHSFDGENPTSAAAAVRKWIGTL